MNSRTEQIETVIKINDLSILKDTIEKRAGANPDKARMTPATFDAFRSNALNKEKWKTLEEAYQRVYVKLKESLTRIETEKAERAQASAEMASDSKLEQEKNSLENVADELQNYRVSLFSFFEPEHKANILKQTSNAPRALKIPGAVSSRIRTIYKNYENKITPSAHMIEATGNWQSVFLSGNSIKVHPVTLESTSTLRNESVDMESKLLEDLEFSTPTMTKEQEEKKMEERFQEMKTISDLGAALQSLRKLCSSDSLDAELKQELKKYIDENTRQLSDILQIDLTLRNPREIKEEPMVEETDIQKVINRVTGADKTPLSEEDQERVQREYDELFNSTEGIERMQSLMRKEYLDYWSQPEVYEQIIANEEAIDHAEEAQTLKRQQEEQAQAEAKKQFEDELARKREEARLAAINKKVEIVNLSEVVKQDATRQNELLSAQSVKPHEIVLDTDTDEKLVAKPREEVAPQPKKVEVVQKVEENMEEKNSSGEIGVFETMTNTEEKPLEEPKKEVVSQTLENTNLNASTDEEDLAFLNDLYGKAMEKKRHMQEVEKEEQAKTVKEAPAEVGNSELESKEHYHELIGATIPIAKAEENTSEVPFNAESVANTNQEVVTEEVSNKEEVQEEPKEVVEPVMETAPVNEEVKETLPSSPESVVEPSNEMVPVAPSVVQQEQPSVSEVVQEEAPVTEVAQENISTPVAEEATQTVVTPTAEKVEQKATLLDLSSVGARIIPNPESRYATETGCRPLKISGRQFNKIQNVTMKLETPKNNDLSMLDELRSMKEDLASIAEDTEKLPSFIR